MPHPRPNILPRFPVPELPFLSQPLRPETVPKHPLQNRATDHPRVIAVDEVYRMMRHPALLKFLINAVKTLRTRRKKVIVIDQQMRVFVQDPQARLLFENCPIRVIFAQRGGEDVFANDPAFSHYTGQHRKIIAELPRFRFLMETDEGIFFLDSKASHAELRRYGSS